MLFFTCYVFKLSNKLYNKRDNAQIFRYDAFDLEHIRLLNYLSAISIVNLLYRPHEIHLHSFHSNFQYC